MFNFISNYLYKNNEEEEEEKHVRKYDHSKITRNRMSHICLVDAIERLNLKNSLVMFCYRCSLSFALIIIWIIKDTIATNERIICGSFECAFQMNSVSHHSCINFLRSVFVLFFFHRNLVPMAPHSENFIFMAIAHTGISRDSSGFHEVKINENNRMQFEANNKPSQKCRE